MTCYDNVYHVDAETITRFLSASIAVSWKQIHFTSLIHLHTSASGSAKLHNFF